MQILVATGGAPHSEAALQFAAYIAAQTDKIPTVITVIPTEAEQDRAEVVLNRARQIFLPTVSEIQTVVRVGHPAEEIIRETETNAYDVVILGERPQHKLMTRFLWSSTAERVLGYAPCPVLIAKGKIAPVQRVLLCDSGNQNSSLLTRVTNQLANLLTHHREVTVLHVMSQIAAGPAADCEQLRADAQTLIEQQTPEGKILARDIELLAGLDVHPRSTVRHGLIVDEILAESVCGDYNLVVIGMHQEKGWHRILLDDLARQIVKQVDRPILVVR